MSKEKRAYFFGELYTGERAEMKPTSVRLPAGFLQDLAIVCEAHGITQSTFFSAALSEGLKQQLAADQGNLLLQVENPQQIKPANEDTRAMIAAIIAEVTALRIDVRAGFKTGINELINYHFEKLSKENSGTEYTSDKTLYNDEINKMRKNAKRGADQ